jgi:hypothetical protein
MTIRFELSSRQLKELADRGRRLHIALPVPEGWDVEDPLAAAKSLIQRVPRSWVRSAELQQVPVLAPLVMPATSLTGHLGKIATPADLLRDDLLIYRVICLVATLQAEEHRRATGALQWPGSVLIDGTRWPRSADTGDPT